ncbi:DUF4181 domain-containing protein [Metabacillus litoralis]|uniref:DUF4181 domain-containing protein n=1 Tax=Metabacillus litoralis TaxID=152268 RepID=UPI001CFD423B|nr:DUF4181 domain-containing protein [Metabacillus litoralis]
MLLIFIFLVLGLIELLFRRLFKMKKVGLFGKYEHHTIKFEKREKILFFSFMLVLMINIIFEMIVNNLLILTVYIMLSSLIRGIEEWQYDRESKEYVFSLANVSCFFVIFFLLLLNIL